jgi:hypothetical protein
MTPPNTPETPEVPENPESREVREVREVRENPDTSEVPETAESRDTPGGPKCSETSGTSETAELPELPEVPGTPGGAAAPADSPATSGVPGTSDCPDDAPGREHQKPRDSRHDVPRSDEPADGSALFDDPALFGETADETAVRVLMHGAVRELRASPDALDHLRRAVPLRRQRRRQAALGAVAAVLLIGMAVPAVIHAAGSSGSPSAAPAGLGGSHHSSPGEVGNTHSRGDSRPSGKASTPPGGTSKSHTIGGSTGRATNPTGSGAPAPDCSGGQLGQGASQAGTPDANGRVYGWFRVSNVSDTVCTVPSGGVVQAVAQGGADQAKIQVVGDTAGDPPLGLPTAATNGPVVLGPGQDYEVAFAWVPSATGSGGCATPTTPPTTPTPSDSATASGGTDTGDDSGSASEGSSQQQGAPPASAPPASVALNHTPAAGAPVVVGPVIQGACAGTVYTTSAIPEPSGTPAS